MIGLQGLKNRKRVQLLPRNVKLTDQLLKQDSVTNAQQQLTQAQQSYEGFPGARWISSAKIMGDLIVQTHGGRATERWTPKKGQLKTKGERLGQIDVLKWLFSRKC